MEREGTEVIRILLVDDVEKSREALRAILAASPHFEIVGEACDGEEAVLAVTQLKPSVVVMDINMPRLNGIEATTWIRRMYPHVVVVGVSAIATEATCQLMKWAGATTVISKETVEHLQHVILESVERESEPTVKHSQGERHCYWSNV
ncbi:MAG TPA: response regulator [Nitrospira sp.]|nr:response regulator [Nitrospira sp.]